MKAKEKHDRLIQHIEDCYAFIAGDDTNSIGREMTQKYDKELAACKDEEARILAVSHVIHCKNHEILMLLEFDQTEKIMQFYINGSETDQFTKLYPLRKALIRRRIVSFFRELIQLAEAYATSHYLLQRFSEKQQDIQNVIKEFDTFCYDFDEPDLHCHEEIKTVTLDFIKAVRGDIVYRN